MNYATIFLAPAVSMMDFYTKDRLAMVTELISKDRYQRIGTLATEKSGEEACEEMFDLSNNPSREHERKIKWGAHRSLSVGDVVHVDGDSWLCDSVGWTKL